MMRRLQTDKPKIKHKQPTHKKTPSQNNKTTAAAWRLPIEYLPVFYCREWRSGILCQVFRREVLFAPSEHDRGTCQCQT